MLFSILLFSDVYLHNVSRTVPPRDSGTHHLPSSMHKLSRHYRNSSRNPRDVRTPSEELMHLIMLQNTIPLRSVTCYTLVLLRTTPHVLSVPIPVHMPLWYSTLWFPFSISPDLFQMKHIVSIYTQMFPPVSPVWISTSVPLVSFSVWSAFQNRTLCAQGRNAQVEAKSFLLPVPSEALPICFHSFPVLLPDPAPIPNPIHNIMLWNVAARFCNKSAKSTCFYKISDKWIAILRCYSAHKIWLRFGAILWREDGNVLYAK